MGRSLEPFVLSVASFDGRFWGKVAKRDGEECWEWQGSRKGGGYGSIGIKGGTVAAHRASWVLTNGAIPDNLWVLHKCDNPPCVRPDHLFLGTRLDNVRDMCAKGRNACRELTAEDVARSEAAVKAIR